MANNLTRGEQLISSKSLNDNIPLFTDLFEVTLFKLIIFKNLYRFIFLFFMCIRLAGATK